LGSAEGTCDGSLDTLGCCRFYGGGDLADEGFDEGGDGQIGHWYSWVLLPGIVRVEGEMGNQITVARMKWC
jgi:hypothetical protein